MCCLLRFAVSVRLCASVTFFCYLAAGASLTLPALTSCIRCVKQNHHTGMKAGTACPLVYRGHSHDCHGSKGKSSGSIKLCPDGCLRHDGQSGEVASIAKFLSPSESLILVPQPVALLSPEQTVLVLTRSLTPQYRPPSLVS